MKDAGGHPTTAAHFGPEPAEPKLFTLSQISEATDIALPTLERYSQLYAQRIPAAGDGLFPEEALAVFQEIQRENLDYIPLPRPAGRLLSLTAQRRARAAAAPAPADDSEPGDPAAVAPEPSPHPPSKPPSQTPGSSNGLDAASARVARRIEAIERSQALLESEIRELVEKMRRPWTGIIEPL